MFRVRAFLCVLVAAIAVAVFNVPAASASVSITGKVQCVTGAKVVGVWVAASSSNSGWASYTARPGNTSVATYTYKLSNGGSYHLDVGCGGSPQSWETNNRTPTVNGSNFWFTCYDHQDGAFYGTCQIT